MGKEHLKKLETLTKREREIVDLSCKLMNSQEIADLFGLSVRTIDTHKTNIFRKLGVKSTFDLLRFVMESKK